MCFFFFKQKTAYEMRISDWSSDVCSSDLLRLSHFRRRKRCGVGSQCNPPCPAHARRTDTADTAQSRSEEHTSELQSLMRISYAVFCLTKKTKIKNKSHATQHKHHHTSSQTTTYNRNITNKHITHHDI